MFITRGGKENEGCLENPELSLFNFDTNSVI
jgi:hypothetical protein